MLQIADSAMLIEDFDERMDLFADSMKAIKRKLIGDKLEWDKQWSRINEAIEKRRAKVEEPFSKPLASRSSEDPQ